jgi:hypothetical protein
LGRFASVDFAITVDFRSARSHRWAQAGELQSERLAFDVVAQCASPLVAGTRRRASQAVFVPRGGWTVIDGGLGT